MKNSSSKVIFMGKIMQRKDFLKLRSIWEAYSQLIDDILTLQFDCDPQSLEECEKELMQKFKNAITNF